MSSGGRQPVAACRSLAGRGFSSVTQPVSTLHTWMPRFASSAALVRVSMLRAAFAMLVCGWSLVFLRTVNWPSTADTFSRYRRGRGDASSRGSSRSASRNGATALTSWTSSISAGSMSPSREVQEFTAAVSVSSPASSTAGSTAAVVLVRGTSPAAQDRAANSPFPVPGTAKSGAVQTAGGPAGGSAGRGGAASAAARAE